MLERFNKGYDTIQAESFTLCMLRPRLGLGIFA